jgi:hypothetical protein
MTTVPAGTGNARSILSRLSRMAVISGESMTAGSTRTSRLLMYGAKVVVDVEVVEDVEVVVTSSSPTAAEPEHPVRRITASRTPLPRAVINVFLS